MWTFTNFGFFSAVRSRDDASKLIVRARAKQDLVSLIDRFGTFLKLSENDIIETQVADYRYRIIVDSTAWGIVLSKCCQDIDYYNFKDDVKAKMGKDRANVYSQVWYALLELQFQGQKYFLNNSSHESYDDNNNRAPTKNMP